jgi:lipid A disaccharide synthetase
MYYERKSIIIIFSKKKHKREKNKVVKMNNDIREDIEIELADVCSNLDELERSMITIYNSHYEKKGWLIYQLKKRVLYLKRKKAKLENLWSKSKVIENIEKYYITDENIKNKLEEMENLHTMQRDLMKESKELNKLIQCLNVGICKAFERIQEYFIVMAKKK